LTETQKLIVSPMVGTFYRAASPDSEPFVEEGDSVRKGQALCIIEAMKMMNEIESDAGGRIVRIMCENGQPIEYGQPLMVIDLG
jgi:acetyl-CoA carboxylase biotin carboxyl carrier protein